MRGIEPKLDWSPPFDWQKKPVGVPRGLSHVGQAVSDTTHMVLAATAISQGEAVADEIAAGYCDGAARHWQDHAKPVRSPAFNERAYGGMESATHG